MTLSLIKVRLILMSIIINWIKANKLTFVLLLIVGYFVFNKFFSSASYQMVTRYGGVDMGSEIAMKSAPAMGIGGMPIGRSDYIPPIQEAPPTTDVANRLVISESYLSLLVQSVVDAQNQIIQTAESLGGYMVNSNLNNPQDAPTATISVRVPSAKLREALEVYRGLAVKVVSENLTGQDVTDQFVDNKARLETLEKTKAKFEEIFDQAVKIEDILTVQREIINLQAEIDSVKGQQNYLEKNAQMARLTVYLSTDEFALPYAPSESWRPEVIFKQAVRSLVAQVRKVGTAFIWLAVYSVIWIPVLVLFFYLKRRNKLSQ